MKKQGGWRPYVMCNFNNMTLNQLVNQPINYRKLRKKGKLRTV